MKVQKALLQLLALVMGITTLVLWTLVAFNSIERPLEVVFLDVGQGDAIYIETPKGSQILIDGGSTQAVLRELSKVVPFWDRSIDFVIATHPDADHIGGLVDVFEAFQVSYVMDTELKRDTPTAKAYERAVELEGVEKITPTRGTRITLDGNVVITVLSQEVVAASNTNEASIVVRLDYGESSFLFTGDATKETERELLSLHRSLDADVLKVGHHGSNTSTSSEFVSAVSPNIAVISVGKNNSYGHPAPEVISTLESQNVKILRTDELGTIRLESDGRIIKERRTGFLSSLFGL